jgi:hypothetical protein
MEVDLTVWTFMGSAKRLEAVDFPRIAKTIGCTEDDLRALAEVEAAGSGFDSKGRPKMLFEPHIFYRLLGKGAARDRAVKEGLAYAKWTPGKYPKDSYTRLQKAMAINATIALMSASWGLFQIMGFNHGAAGYASPEEMVRDFMEDEDNHVEAVVRFLTNKKLDDDLRAHRWQVVEDVYNGGGYGGAYARKLAAAYAKWQKIKDTPLPVEKKAQEAPAPVPAPAEPAPQPSQPAASVAAEEPPSVVAMGGAFATVAGGASLMGVPLHIAAIAAGAAFLICVAVLFMVRK